MQVPVVPSVLPRRVSRLIHSLPARVGACLAVLCLLGAPAHAQEAAGSGAGSGASVEEVIAEATPDATTEAESTSLVALGTDTMETHTLAISAQIEGWLTEAAPWALASVLGIAMWRVAAFFLTLLLFFAGRRALMNVVMRLVAQLTRRTHNAYDDAFFDALKPPLGAFVQTLGVYLALLWLPLSDSVHGMVDSVYRVAVIAIVGWGLLRCVDVVTAMMSAMAAKTESKVDDNLVPLISRMMRLILVAMVVVIVLQEVGLNVAGLVTGLGVGGLALALAAQDTIANWFGAIMIYTDRPFEQGDWIKTPDLEGVVEDIGLRSTRIRTFDKSVVSVPNRALADAAVDNYSRMPKRRVTFKLGVTYSTTPSMMRETLERIRDILRADPSVDQSFWLVNFTEFDDSALSILIYFYTETTDWQRHLAIRESVNLQIMDALEEIGVQAAFPSRSVYMETPDPGALDRYDAKSRALYEGRTKRTDLHKSYLAPSDADM